MLFANRYDLDYFPAPGYARLDEDTPHLTGLRGLSLSAPVLRQVLWDNAVRLYGLDDAGSEQDRRKAGSAVEGDLH